MTVELDKNDLIRLVKGTTPDHHRAADAFHTAGFGDLVGFPIQSWQWYDGVLQSMTEAQLWYLYRKVLISADYSAH